MKNLLLILFIAILSTPIFSQTPNANAGADTSFCGYSGNLHAILTEGTGTWTSTLPAHVTISDPSDPESEVHCDILTSGHPTYPYVNFIWTVTLGEETDSDTVRVQFNRIPSSEIEFIPAKCFGESFTISAYEDSLSSYQWNFYGGIVDETFTNPFNGDFQNFVHWEGTDTAHVISLIATNYWGCQSPINIDTIYEPLIPTFETEIYSDTCLLGKGAIVFADTLGTSAFFWLNQNVGPSVMQPFTTVYGLPAGDYSIYISYLTPNVTYYAYYLQTYGTANCIDTLVLNIGSHNIFDLSCPSDIVITSHTYFNFTHLSETYPIGGTFYIEGEEATAFNSSNFENGTYLVTYLYYDAITSCQGVCDFNIVLDVNSHVNQTDLKNDFSVFPNPTMNWVVVESDKYQISQIRIIDITGKELINIENFDNKKIDISNLNSGYYRIIINSDGGEYNLPLIKQ